ncbi:hypothetical protein ACIA5G_37095 [Amycolatopsis sp. NPDC051758]|uniref:hypothetical protein n=1 Tax=Amycolatopsis sp. NPDC051758 TaxID=3363935 RepID=UPI00378AAEFE
MEIRTLSAADLPACSELAATAVLVSFGSVSSISMVLVESRFERHGVDRRPLLERLGTAYAVDGGFAFGTDIGHVTVLGPVVADTEAQARALIRGAARSASGEVRVDPDFRFPELTAWVRERGLVPTAPAPRLVLAGRPLPGDPAKRFAPFTRAVG